MQRGWAARLPLCAAGTGASIIPRRSSRLGCSCISGDDRQQCGPYGCVQLCPEGGGAGQVKGAGQILVQLLSRGDRWDKRAQALQGPVN